jgi:BNR repeat-like domain
MLIKKTAIIACIALLMALSSCAQQQQTKQETPIENAPTTSNVPKPVRVSADNTDAAEPSVASAPDGTVYVAWVEHREKKEADVMLAHVDREGQTVGAPVRVNPTAGEATAWRGDPPTVAVGADGTIYVGWTARVAAEGHADDLYLSASRDKGKTFEQPVKVNDDGKKVTHAMHSLAVAADNRVYVVWLDERNVVMPAADGKGMKMEHMEANREVFFAASSDGGRSFSPNQRLAKEACPCCKTAVIAGKDNRVYASWRQVLPGEFRHIALAASEDGGKTFSQPVIVSDDRWMTASCPVSGPSLSTGDDGALRVVWYTEGDKGAPGLYWAESRDNGRKFSESRPLAKGQARGNPLLLANGGSGATVIWESNEGGAPRVMSAPLAGDGAVTTSPLTTSGELPSATLSGDQLFVGYISKVNDRRSIWIVRAKPAV